MALQASLVFLPLAVLVAVIIDVSSAGEVVVLKKTYFSSEATQMADRLNAYMFGMENRYVEFGENLMQNNELLTTVKKSRTTYEKAKETACAGEEPPKMEDDDDLMMSFVDKCHETLRSPPLTDFYKTMKVPKAKLEELDEALKQNAATCVTDPTGCEATKEEKLKELNSLLTDEQAAMFQAKVDKAVADCTEKLKNCFLSAIKDLHDKLEKRIKETEDCLANHK